MGNEILAWPANSLTFSLLDTEGKLKSDLIGVFEEVQAKFLFHLNHYVFQY